MHFWPASAGTQRSGEGTTVPLVRHRLTTGLCSRQQTTQHSQTRAAPEPRGCSCGVASNDKSALQLLLPFPRASTNSSSCPVTLSPSGLCVGPSAFSPISSKVGCPQSRTSDLRGFISRTHRATASCPVVPAPSSASSRPGVAWRLRKAPRNVGAKHISLTSFFLD